MAAKKENNKRKKGFFSNWIVRNLLAAFALMVFLIVGAVVFLDVVTMHNQELIVPDLYNLQVSEAEEIAGQAGMRTDVTDSIFVKRMKRGAIYRQNPPAGAKVKKGRRISLTINAVNAEKVTMPNLVGYSMRQAKAELLSRGLVLGKLIYVHDMATNNVLSQLHDNSEIEPGTLVDSESVIDLVVGLDPSDNTTCVPDVIGLKQLRAVDAVHDNSLNIRRLVFDDTVKDYDDSLNAVVYRQNPAGSDSVRFRMGSDVSLYMTVDAAKVPVREIVQNEQQGF